MKRILYILALIFLFNLGCEDDNPPILIEDIKNNISVYTEPVPDFAISDKFPESMKPDKIMALEEAMAYWEVFEGVNFYQVQNPNKADLYVKWIKDFGREAGWASNKNRIDIGLGDSQCYNEWRPYRYKTIYLIARHELGHILGYEHSDDENNVMAPIVKVSYQFEIQDENVLPSGYAKFYPICNRYEYGSYKISGVTDIDNKGDLKIYIGTIKDFERLQKGVELPNLRFTCNISSGMWSDVPCSFSTENGIILHNTGNKAKRYELRVESFN